MEKTIYTTTHFDKWFDALKDKRAKMRIQMRIHYGAGYRVYYIQRGLEVIILLAGGDKSTQQRDIKQAIELARTIKD